MIKRVQFQKEKEKLTVFGVYCPEEVEGELVIGADPEEIMGVGRLTAKHRQKIVFTGSLLSRELIAKGVVIGVAGFLAGGMSYQELNLNSLPICLMEGFGELVVSNSFWEVISKFEGRKINLQKGKTEEMVEIRSSDQVRLIGDPGPIGLRGRVVSQLKKKEFYPGVKIEMIEIKVDGDKKKIEVPLVNLEVVL